MAAPSMTQSQTEELDRVNKWISYEKEFRRKMSDRPEDLNNYFQNLEVTFNPRGRPTNSTLRFKSYADPKNRNDRPTVVYDKDQLTLFLSRGAVKNTLLDYDNGATIRPTETLRRVGVVDNFDIGGSTLKSVVDVAKLIQCVASGSDATDYFIKDYDEETKTYKYSYKPFYMSRQVAERFLTKDPTQTKAAFQNLDKVASKVESSVVREKMSRYPARLPLKFETDAPGKSMWTTSCLGKEPGDKQLVLTTLPLSVEGHTFNGRGELTGVARKIIEDLTYNENFLGSGNAKNWTGTNYFKLFEIMTVRQDRGEDYGAGLARLADHARIKDQNVALGTMQREITRLQTSINRNMAQIQRTRDRDETELALREYQLMSQNEDVRKAEAAHNAEMAYNAENARMSAGAGPSSAGAGPSSAGAGPSSAGAGPSSAGAGPLTIEENANVLPSYPESDSDSEMSSTEINTQKRPMPMPYSNAKKARVPYDY